jgi:hypothetical protein
MLWLAPARPCIRCGFGLPAGLVCQLDSAENFFLAFSFSLCSCLVMNEPLSINERFAMSLEGLCRAVAARIAGGAMLAWMIVAVWGRIRRVERDFLALLARYQAGRLRVRGQALGGASHVGAPHVSASHDPAPPQRGALETLEGAAARHAGDAAVLPRRFGWLLPLAGYQAVNFASQIRHMLEDAQIQQLLAASAQARRILAPLCEMLGLERDLLRGPVVRAGAHRVAARVGAARRPACRPALPPERIPLSRSILAAARRDGFAKRGG